MSEIDDNNKAIDAAMAVLRAINGGHEPYAANVSPTAKALKPLLAAARAEGEAAGKALATRLVAAMVEWGSWGDGVPEDGEVGEAFDAAQVFLRGEYVAELREILAKHPEPVPQGPEVERLTRQLAVTLENYEALRKERGQLLASHGPITEYEWEAAGWYRPSGQAGTAVGREASGETLRKVNAIFAKRPVPQEPAQAMPSRYDVVAAIEAILDRNLQRMQLAEPLAEYVLSLLRLFPPASEAVPVATPYVELSRFYHAALAERDSLYARLLSACEERGGLETRLAECEANHAGDEAVPVVTTGGGRWYQAFHEQSARAEAAEAPPAEPVPNTLDRAEWIEPIGPLPEPLTAERRAEVLGAMRDARRGEPAPAASVEAAAALTALGGIWVHVSGDTYRWQRADAAPSPVPAKVELEERVLLIEDALRLVVNDWRADYGVREVLRGYLEKKSAARKAALQRLPSCEKGGE